MGRNKTGYSSDTKKHLLLGAGAIFKNFNVGQDTYENAKAKIVGATQGGNEFKAVPAVRSIQVDGILGKAKDLDVIDSWDVSLTVTFLEASVQVIRAALGASKLDTTDSSYDEITADTEFKLEDYFDNITYIGTIAGAKKPVIIQLYNAINMGGLTVKGRDNAEGTIQVVFEGRYTIENQDDAPFDIYYPKMLKATPDSVTITGTASVDVAVSGAQGAVSVSSADISVATASYSSNTLEITGVAPGKTYITVTDGDENVIRVAVTVVAGE